MLLYPDLYFKNVQSIDLAELSASKIKGIILDVDNTLIDYKLTMPDGIKDWVGEAKRRDFKICILSNSNKKEKVSKVAKELGLEYLLNAKKPMKNGYKKALKILDLPNKECVAIGDQLFTDVIGANRMKIVSAYVEPINKREYWYTKWKRPIEECILKMYKRNNGRK